MLWNNFALQGLAKKNFAQLGRLTKDEFKIIADAFLFSSDLLDKDYLERLELMASELYNQSREKVKIVNKGMSSDTSPLFKQPFLSSNKRERINYLKKFLVLNAHWNEERKDTAANDNKKKASNWPDKSRA